MEKCRDGSIVLVTTLKRSYKKVMFSQASVCSWGGGGSQVTITHDALDITVPTPPPRQTLDLGNHPPLLLASSGDHLRPVQTCELPPLVPTPMSDGKCAVRNLLECFLVISE